MSELTIKKLSFQKRPIPLPAEYRPMYKIALIVMILKFCCRSETSSLIKLHLLSWALASKKNMEEITQFINSDFTSEFSIWGIEPALNRGLQFAIAEGFCDMINGKNYKLTEKGNEFFNLILSDHELFSTEKFFLLSVGRNTITDVRISLITKKWNLFYA